MHTYIASLCVWEREKYLFYIWGFLVNPTGKFKVHWNIARISGTLYGDLCTFVTIIRLEWGIFETKFVDKITMYIFYSITFF